MKQRDNKTDLKARAIIGADLFKEGKIERCECLRLEIDALLGKNTGPINYKNNQDYDLRIM